MKPRSELQSDHTLLSSHAKEILSCNETLFNVQSPTSPRCHFPVLCTSFDFFQFPAAEVYVPAASALSAYVFIPDITACQTQICDAAQPLVTNIRRHTHSFFASLAIERACVCI